MFPANSPMAADPPARPKRGRNSSSDQLSPEPRDDVKRSTNKTVDIHLGNCQLIALGYINLGVDRIETRIRDLIRRNEQANTAVARRRKGQGRRSRRQEQEVGSALSPILTGCARSFNERGDFPRLSSQGNWQEVSKVPPFVLPMYSILSMRLRISPRSNRTFPSSCCRK